MKNENIEKTNIGLPLWLRWIITSVLVILIVFLIFILLKPLRIYSSHKYVRAGDEYLASQKYLHADLAYQKALILAPKNPEIMAKKTLAKEASLDVERLEEFYRSANFTDRESRLNVAVAFPDNETSALKVSKKLIEQGEYQLAIIPAKTATEMDPGYRDAWLYLGIANLKTAELVELSPDAKQQYLDQAKLALDKAFEIDPEYKVTAEYLKLVN